MRSSLQRRSARGKISIQRTFMNHLRFLRNASIETFLAWMNTISVDVSMCGERWNSQILNVTSKHINEQGTGISMVAKYYCIMEYCISVMNQLDMQFLYNAPYDDAVAIMPASNIIILAAQRGLWYFYFCIKKCRMAILQNCFLEAGEDIPETWIILPLIIYSYRYPLFYFSFAKWSNGCFLLFLNLVKI